MPSKVQRPVDLARVHGLSAQAVRNYEAAGILPAAERSVSGYRAYTGLHAAALAAFVALVPGHGHQAAAEVLRAVHRGAVDDALRVVDDGHLQLVEDRRTLLAVEAAVGELGPVPQGVQGRGDTFVGPLSRRLGVRPATLRKWERAGLVRPGRDPRTGYRVYGAADVRDALLVHQLRRGGYLLEQIGPVLAQVRSAGGVPALEAVLGDWRARLAARGRAMLAGAAALDAYLRARDNQPRTPDNQPRTRDNQPRTPDNQPRTRDNQPKTGDDEPRTRDEEARTGDDR